MKGLIISLILFVFLVTQVSALTVINEIMYDPKGSDNNKEFIEIYSDEFNDFGNYTIEDLSGNRDNLILAKQENSRYFLIVEDGFNYENINATVYKAGATIGNGLNNDKDVIIFRNENNDIADLFYYTSDWGGKNNGKSLERLDKGGFSNDKENWVESISENGSPGEENNINNFDFHDIEINEILPDPVGHDDASMPEGEFVEIYNDNEEDINLENFYLEDSSRHRIIVDDSHTYDEIIKKKSYLVVYMNGFSGFLNNDEDEIKLFYNNILIDKIKYSNTKEGFSWAKLDNKFVFVHPTPEKNNEDGIILDKPFVKILDYDKRISFGDVMEIKLEIYKPNLRKNSINLVLENENYKISEEVNFNVYGKYINYTINMPLQLYPNCNSKFSEGAYRLKVYGIENKDEKEVEVYGLNSKICNIKENKDDEGIKIEMLQVPERLTENDEIVTKVKFTNNSTKSQEIEVWSYVYNDKESLTGDFQENLKQIKLGPNSEGIVELKNNFDGHIEEGGYKIKVRVKKEGRKTTDDFISDIKISLDSNLSTAITGNTVYESTDVKAKNLGYFIFVFSLILLISFLIFRKGL